MYKEVIARRGIDAVIAKKQWKEVAEALQLPSSCTDSGFRLRLHYKKYLEAFERKFFQVPPGKKEASCSASSIGSGTTVGEEVVSGGSSASGSIGSGDDDCGGKRRGAIRKKPRFNKVASDGRRRLELLQVAAGVVGGRLDFSVLEEGSLRKYAKVYGVKEGEEKVEGKRALVEKVSKHFDDMSLGGGETETLLKFIEAVQVRRRKE